MSNGYPVNLASLISGENQSLGVLEVIDGVGDYETVGISANNQVMGTTGAAGDYLHRLICVVTGTGSLVQLKDGSGTAFTVLPTAIASVNTFVIPIGMKSTLGAWQVTTGANVTVVAVGAFT